MLRYRSSSRSRFSPVKAVAVAASAALLGTLLTVIGPGVTEAEAAVASEFDAGYIISDDLFFDDDAMTESQIQSFLEAKSGTCSNSSCLDILRVDTSDKSSSWACKAYSGADNERVSTILYRIQSLCGISARVLLVTLEKEQGLVSSRAPTSVQLKIAMGYGCPDTAPCDTAYYGIDNQIYWAGRAFGYYRIHNPNASGEYRGSDGHEVGTQAVRYHPSASCGSKTVTIRNEATAALYNYTPYTPNSAALDNLYGTGNSCSSYGNRNFWRIYTDWFGSPTGQLSSDVTASRVYGDDRYETSVAVSQSAYPDPESVSVVFVASGENFPDGLAAGPAAAIAGAPLLLTEKSSLPSVTRAEIERLAPDIIYVVGGTPAVSSSVASKLNAIAPVTRLSGDDRYATAREIARAAFPDGADEVFIAIGNNFPDALAASAAAGMLGAPVILVPSLASSADSATRSLIADLGATRVVAAGSKSVIKSSYLTSLKSGTSVTELIRLGGDDRYDTATLINEYAFPEATASYLAYGVNFPDALSAAAVAGAQGAALHLSPGSCLTSSSVAHLTSAGVEQLIFVGSKKVLTSSAYSFKPC